MNGSKKTACNKNNTFFWNKTENDEKIGNDADQKPSTVQEKHEELSVYLLQ